MAFKVQSEYTYLPAEVEKPFFFLKEQGGIILFSGDSSGLLPCVTRYCHLLKSPPGEVRLLQQCKRSCPQYRLMTGLTTLADSERMYVTVRAT